MKRVRAQGCLTLYKSQVILSTKDTPLVPKLCIKSQHDGVLDRPPVILLPATHLLEPVRRVQGARRGVGVAHLEVDLPDAARRQRLENVLHERASQPGTPAGGGHGKVQDLAFVGGIERNHVPHDRATRSFRDEKLVARSWGTWLRSMPPRPRHQILPRRETAQTSRSRGNPAWTTDR